MNQPNPYRAPTSTFEDAAETSAYPDTTPQLASRWSRLFAKLVDTAAIVVIVAVAALVAGFLQGFGVAEDTTLILGVGLGGLGALGLLGYNLNRLHSHGQTLGKQVFKIRIVRSQSLSPVSLSRLIGLRYLPIYLGSNIPFIGSFLALFNVLMIFANDRRCLHDHIADTTVIDYVPGDQLLSPMGKDGW